MLFILVFVNVGVQRLPVANTSTCAVASTPMGTSHCPYTVYQYYDIDGVCNNVGIIYGVEKWFYYSRNINSIVSTDM